MTHRRSESGFTLIEMLVVVALLGLLSMLVLTSIGSATGLWRRLSTRDDDAASVQATHDLLSGLLSATYPLLEDRSDDRSHLVFDGEPDQIRFLAPLRQSYGTDAIVLYRLSRKNRHLALSWQFGETFPGTVDRDGPTDIPMKNINDPVFSYYGYPTDARTGDKAWFSRWSDRRSMPQLIALHISVHGSDETWMVAPLRTASFCAPHDADSLCSH